MSYDFHLNSILPPKFELMPEDASARSSMDACDPPGLNGEASDHEDREKEELYKVVSEAVRSLQQSKKSFLDLAVESWRFSRLFERLLEKLDADEARKYQGQLAWFVDKREEAIRKAGMRTVNAEGKPFDPGVAATPLNAGDFDPEEALVVDRMLTPIIMGPDGVERTGTVMLKRNKVEES